MSGRAEVDALDAALKAEDAEERRHAAARLCDVAPDAAAPLLLQALGDVDWRVRKEATFAGAKLLDARDGGADASVLSALLSALAPGDNVGLRNAAIEVLGHGGGAATSALSGAMAELDADGRKLVVEALARTRDPNALGALESALSDPDGNVRQAAIEAIALMGAIARDRVAAILRRSLADADRFVRLTALVGLNVLEEPVAWPALAPLLQDSMLRPAALAAAALAESPDAPAALVRALATVRGAAFAQVVAALARLSDGPLAGHVANALRSAGADVGERLARAASGAPASRTQALPSVIPGLAPEAPDAPEPPSWPGATDAMSQRARALVLAAIADAPGTAEAAVDALSEPALMEPAHRALALLGPPALPALVAEIARRLDAGADALDRAVEATAAIVDAAVMIAREAQAAALAAGRPVDTEPRAEPSPALMHELRRAASDASTLIATSALYGLGKLGFAEDLELAAERTLVEALPVAHAAEAALAALSERHPEAARARARTMREAEGMFLPAAIVLEALGASAPDEVEFLQRVTEARDARVRRAAIQALVAAPGLPGLSVLSKALQDDERQVRLAAARAVGHLVAVLDSEVASARSASHLGSAEAGTADRVRELLDVVRRSGDAELWSAARWEGATESGRMAAREEP